jgi:ribosomal protein L36
VKGNIMDITQFLLDSRVYNSHRAIEICEITRRTWRLWIKNKSIPKHYQKLLRLGGTTDILWEGYSISEKFIHLPTNEVVPKSRIDGWWIIEQRLRRLEIMDRSPVQFLLFDE